MIKLLINIILTLFISKINKATNQNSWVTTQWARCEDKLACTRESKRYCPGDKVGTSCGPALMQQPLYYRSLQGCLPKSSRNCKKWETIKQTKCNAEACDYTVIKRCKQKESCILTYLYTCNQYGYINCTGEWSQWKIKRNCQDVNHSTNDETETLQRTCTYDGRISFSCGGNIENETTQTETFIKKRKRLSTIPILSCVTETTENTKTESQPDEINATVPVVCTIAGLLLLIGLGYIGKKQLEKYKQETGCPSEHSLCNSEPPDNSSKQQQKSKKKVPQTVIFTKNNKVQRKESNLYHIYEEIQTQDVYEFASETPPIILQRPADTLIAPTVPINHEGVYIDAENAYLKIEDGHMNENEDGYLLPSTSFNSSFNKKQTNAKSTYLDLEAILKKEKNDLSD